MTPTIAARITKVAKMRDGVLVTFDDGRCALYSASLPHEIFHDAETICSP